ncbi:hypothetical protein SK128_016807, partial [Halocaridina rubra]
MTTLDMYNSHDVDNRDACKYYVNVTGPSGEVLKREYPCTKWEYDTSVYSSTLTSEFDLVCDRGYFRATYQSLPEMAAVFSSFIIGYLAD